MLILTPPLSYFYDSHASGLLPLTIHFFSSLQHKIWLKLNQYICVAIPVPKGLSFLSNLFVPYASVIIKGSSRKSVVRFLASKKGCYVINIHHLSQRISSLEFFLPNLTAFSSSHYSQKFRNVHILLCLAFPGLLFLSSFFFTLEIIIHTEYFSLL